MDYARHLCIAAIVTLFVVLAGSPSFAHDLEPANRADTRSHAAMFVPSVNPGSIIAPFSDVMLTATTAVTTTTFTPSDDATIREAGPTGNYGTQPILEVDGESRKDMLLRFDVSGIGASSVSSAVLRLYAVDGSSLGGEFFKMNDANWSESTVTWETAPPGDGGSLGFLRGVIAGNWYELDVTPLVTTDGPVSMRAKSTDANGADYASKEDPDGFAPELVVKVSESPAPDVTPPTAPSSLITVSVLSNAVTLGWNSSTDDFGVTAYGIARNGHLLTTIGPVTTYQDATVMAETAYTYTVHARDAAGNTSDPSNELHVNTPAPDTTPPVAPDNLTAISVLANGVNLGWDAATDDVGVTGYEIYRDGDLLTTVGSVTTYQDATVTAETAYQYTVRARDAAGNSSDPSNALDVNTPTAPVEIFTFAAAGDHGDSGVTTASLDLLADVDADFYLALGDLSYSETISESVWCDYVQQHVGETYPFELLVGNHEDRVGDDGYIDNFAACLPDRLGVTGAYAHRYYFDYPAAAPRVRFLLIDPNTYRGDSRVEYCKNGESVECHWLAARIDEAQVEGLWVIVGMHKNCITMGIKSCEIGPELLNMLIEKKVDLILQGHEHTYQRSKQLAHSPTCPAIEVDAYDGDCVSDDGADGVYTRGQGPIVVIAGAFGKSLYPVDVTDPEAGYFVRWSGANESPSNGFVKYTVSDNAIHAQYMISTGDLSDSFSIVDASSPPDSTPPTAPGNLAATDVNANAVTLGWGASTDNVGVVGYDIYRDGSLLTSAGPVTIYGDNTVSAGVSYQYAVRARDLAGNVSGPSNTLEVTTPDTDQVQTFISVADATIREDSPTSNFGAEPTLEVDASSRKDALLRFEISGIGAATVTSAILRLYVDDGSSSGGEFFVMSNANWDESTVTWETAPPGDGGSLGSLDSVASNNWYDIDVTPMVTGDGLAGIRISSSNQDGVDYASKENPNGFAPELIVTADKDPVVSPSDTTLIYVPIVAN